MQDLRWPTYALRDVVLERAEPDERGSLRVRDIHGRTYLDAINGVGCVPQGHGHARWVAAVHAQLQTLVAAANSFTSTPQQTLGARLAAMFPVDDARTFFGSSGTEATEAAIKLALRSTKRNTLVAFERAFHGRSLGALSLTANTAYRHPYVRCLGETEPAEPFATARVLRLPFDDIAALHAAFSAHAKDIAAVFVEPIQGEAGVFPASREFLLEIHRLCREHGALVGADEIQSGSGRTGAWAAWTRIVGDDPALPPDLLWLAKASTLSVHDLKGYIQEHFGATQEGRELVLTVLSFGFKLGPPAETDLVFYVRFLKNPHFDPRLRRLTGLDPRIVSFLKRAPGTVEFQAKLTDFLTFVIPKYVAEGKAYLTIGICCTGGRHRSVMIARELAQELDQIEGVTVRLRHRDPNQK